MKGIGVWSPLNATESILIIGLNDQDSEGLKKKLVIQDDLIGTVTLGGTVYIQLP